MVSQVCTLAITPRVLSSQTFGDHWGKYIANDGDTQ